MNKWTQNPLGGLWGGVGRRGTVPRRPVALKLLAEGETTYVKPDYLVELQEDASTTAITIGRIIQILDVFNVSSASGGSVSSSSG